MTCDKPICDDCTTRVNGFDFCPDCIQKIKNAKRGLK
nr:MAG TPA: putative tRNA pseudouridine synthase [Caudoviricetes sp.]DAV52688.1 MAG TPA: putative tRNA pseudouridine synthase B-Protein complex, Box H/ACA, snoRNP.95A [Caudoviricetes sp.]